MRFGSPRKGRTEQHRLTLLMKQVRPPGEMLESGPGHGSVAAAARGTGWRYRAKEANSLLVERLRAQGLEITQAWAPPIAASDASCDVVYADQVLEHMSGIDIARQFVAKAQRAFKPGGVFFVVVPDCLKERGFFWDVDYTHKFVTTQRRVPQLLYDDGFEVEEVVRSIGAAAGLTRDLLAAAAVLATSSGCGRGGAIQRHG